ncbi:glycosyltransferase family 2 protein [Glaciecola sp. SC05]|uniref:glycosyltransferase family 2 protein n=1 Tax=Glaciecola sp. SC05 TaxID=1987355 RepID=UPI003529C9C3
MISVKPKVSVCIVSYNQEHYIEQCLQSVVSQESEFEIEVIVSDDCSSDGTQQIIKKFAAEYNFIKPFLRTENVGALRNYVETHNRASNEYVCHLDGDDIWLPNKIQKQYDFLESHPTFSVCWTKSNFFNDYGLKFDGQLTNLKFFGDEGFVNFDKLAQVGAVAMHSSIMYRRCARITTDNAFDKIDLFYSLEFLLSGNGKILDDVLTEYRVQSSGAITRNSGTKIKRVAASNIRYFLEKHPVYSSSFFVFCFVNLIVDIKNNRDTKRLFFKLVLRTISVKGIIKFIRFLPYVKHFKVPRLC